MVNGMASVVSESITKSSKTYNLSHLIFGYALAFSFFSLQDFVTVPEYFVYVATVGGFIGTFLLFFNPWEKLFFLFFREREFYSPYLYDIRGKIVGGFYFFLTCLVISFFNSNFENLNLAYVNTISFFLVAMGGIIIVISIYELFKLGEKIDLLTKYYGEIRVDTTMKEDYYRNADGVRDALIRGDWTEVQNRLS